MTEVLSGDQPELPLETVMSSHALLRGTVPTSLDEVAERYRTVLQEAVQAWKANADGRTGGISEFLCAAGPAADSA